MQWFVRTVCDLCMVHKMVFDSTMNITWWQRLLLPPMGTMWMNSAVEVEHVRCCFDSNNMVHRSNGCRIFPMKLKLAAHTRMVCCIELLFVHRHLSARGHRRHFRADQLAYCADRFQCL